MATEYKALNTFIGKIGEINEKLETLRWYVDNHMESDPGDVNWGHVGSAAHVIEELDDLINFLGITGQRTETKKEGKIDKQIAGIMLTDMERIRQKNEHRKGIEDWCIRVCQAIVAKEAGYTGRNEWSPPIFESVKKELEAVG